MGRLVDRPPPPARHSAVVRQDDAIDLHGRRRRAGNLRVGVLLGLLGRKLRLPRGDECIEECVGVALAWEEAGTPTGVETRAEEGTHPGIAAHEALAVEGEPAGRGPARNERTAGVGKPDLRSRARGTGELDADGLPQPLRRVDVRSTKQIRIRDEIPGMGQSPFDPQLVGEVGQQPLEERSAGRGDLDGETDLPCSEPSHDLPRERHRLRRIAPAPLDAVVVGAAHIETGLYGSARTSRVGCGMRLVAAGPRGRKDGPRVRRAHQTGSGSGGPPPGRGEGLQLVTVGHGGSLVTGGTLDAAGAACLRSSRRAGGSPARPAGDEAQESGPS